MSRHPLLKLAIDREVRQASAFREAAKGLTGEEIGVHYKQEVEQAPRRAQAGLPFLAPYNRRLSGTRRKNRDEEHLALALVDQRARTGAGLDLPEGGVLEPLHAVVPLQAAEPVKDAGEEDPNWGVGRADLLALGPEDRLALVCLKFVAKDATRPGVGDTPLRMLLHGLAHAAIVQANRDALVEELSAAGIRVPSEGPPMLALVATPQYWMLCRKREAQKGAAWIKEFERLAGEIEDETGVTVAFLGIELEGDPGWEYPEGMPVLSGGVKLVRAWEPGAGRVKPKPRPKPQVEAEPPVEADLSRPIRKYAVCETFEPGERVEHATLGLGVVQGGAGPGKIHVLFDDRKVLLVHGRASSG